MAQKLVVMLVNTDPGRAIEVGTPLFQAAMAASMDYTVEVIVSGASGILMKKGEAEKIVIKPGSGKTALDFIRMAKRGGARFLLCAGTFELLDYRQDDLIPECDGLAALTDYIPELMDDNVRVLCF